LGSGDAGIIALAIGGQRGLYCPLVSVEFPGVAALEMGPFDLVVRIFASEVTSDQTLGNWYHFMKHIRGVKK
jgi:hypothetical protein